MVGSQNPTPVCFSSYPTQVMCLSSWKKHLKHGATEQLSKTTEKSNE